MTDNDSKRPSCATPTCYKGTEQMSSALRRRLKRSRRSFSSPCRSHTNQNNCGQSTEAQEQDVQKDDAKRLGLSAEYTDKESQAESSPSNNHATDATTNCTTGTVGGYPIKNARATIDPSAHHRSVNEAVTPDTGTCMKKQDIGDPLAEKQRLQDVIAQLDENLRRLNLVKSHKKDLFKLQQLTARWQQVSQQVLLQLQERAYADQRLTLGQLMDHMGIDENMLELDREQDCFNC
ncbi:swi5-dependent recombination DNA repair protein 1 homolog [Branchiostoma lanceolatum]|uniref:swi5-dependent recombination DNA repair protein 1 homolog n=1 Tax=Branchiostoma lanceolatum TaxID=7740 RepID=UPI003452985A